VLAETVVRESHCIKSADSLSLAEVKWRPTKKRRYKRHAGSPCAVAYWESPKIHQLDHTFDTARSQSHHDSAALCALILVVYRADIR